MPTEIDCGIATQLSECQVLKSFQSLSKWRFVKSNNLLKVDSAGDHPRTASTRRCLFRLQLSWFRRRSLSGSLSPITIPHPSEFLSHSHPTRERNQLVRRGGKVETILVDRLIPISPQNQKSVSEVGTWDSLNIQLTFFYIYTLLHKGRCNFGTSFVA